MRIINILPQTPPYDLLHNETRPPLSWDTSDGAYVAIAGYDWPDLLGAAVRRYDSSLTYEVWQPDLRADTEYRATLDSGVVHCLIPTGPSDQRARGWDTKSLVNRLFEQKTPFLLHLNELTGLTQDIVRNFRPIQTFPIVISGHGSERTPLSLIRITRRVWRIPSLVVAEFDLRRDLRTVGVITEQHEPRLKEIRRAYNGRIMKLTMGCDFTFWHPRDRAYDRSAFDNKYNTKGKRVFLCVCNFIPVKQLDLLIAALTALGPREDYLMLMVGHGTRAYEEYLHGRGKTLLNWGNLAFHKYVRDEQLRDLYWAADFFTSTSAAEGGPVSVFQAFACGLPVISTEIGAAAEVMRETSTGMLLNPRRPRQWTACIRQVLAGLPVPQTPVHVSRARFSWEVVGLKYLEIYKMLWQQYYG